MFLNVTKQSANAYIVKHRLIAGYLGLFDVLLMFYL